MSLNTIEFSKRNIADLYKNNLVELSGNNPPGPVFQDQVQWKYLGENRKNTLIVVNYPDAVHIPDKQLSFLINLLSACKLNLGDTAVLNFHHYTAKDFNSIISHFEPKKVFLFSFLILLLFLSSCGLYRILRFDKWFYNRPLRKIIFIVIARVFYPKQSHY